MSDRLERIRSALAEAELDALLVSVPVDDGFGRHADNRKYVSGFTGSTGIALVTMERALFAADFRYTEQAERECVPRGFEVFKALGSSKEWYPNFLREAKLGGKRLGVSRNDMSLAGWVNLQERIAGMEPGERPEPVPAPLIIETLRRRKDAEELALLQRAIDIADAAFEALSVELDPGMTEIEVAETFARNVVAGGGDADLVRDHRRRRAMGSDAARASAGRADRRQSADRDRHGRRVPGVLQRPDANGGTRNTRR